MIPKSGNRFSDKIMRNQRVLPNTTSDGYSGCLGCKLRPTTQERGDLCPKHCSPPCWRPACSPRRSAADADRRGANNTASRAGKEASQDEEAADAGAARRARAAEEVRRRMEGSQGRRQDREGNEVAEILERLQQAPQGGRLAHDPEKLVLDLIGDGNRFSEKIMRSF